MANGDIVRIGSMAVGGTVLTYPNNPKNGGDVYNYGGGSSAIEFRDTPTNTNNRLAFVEVNLTTSQASELGLSLPTGKMYIADRCWIMNISWNALNAQNLITGKTVTIDGQQYKVISLTGGTSSSDKNNMWDKIVCNSLNLSGLPTGTTSDTSETSISNQKWHWYYMYTWCQEASAADARHRALRGHLSAADWNYGTAAYGITGVGFRPALIPLNSSPLISDSDTALGDKSTAFSINYTITEDNASQTFTLTEKINNTVLRTLTNQPGGSPQSYTLDLTSVWGSLEKGTHTITITASDNQGATSVRTYTFVISNNVPSPPTHGYLSGTRLPVSGYIEFYPQLDTDNATLAISLQFATNSSFTSGLQTFTAGLQRWNGTAWVDVSNVAPAYYGILHRLPYSGFVLYQSFYMRIGASDGAATSYSSAVQVSVGTTLEFKTQPITRSEMPTAINVILDGTFSGAAGQSITAKCCNNALDDEPTWEEASADLADINHAHYFTNTTKTAADWAIQAWITIYAGDAVGTIEVRNLFIGTSP